MTHSGAAADLYCVRWLMRDAILPRTSAEPRNACLVPDDDATSWIRLPFLSSKCSKLAQDEHDSSPAIEKSKRRLKSRGSVRPLINRPGRLLNLRQLPFWRPSTQ